MEQYLDHDLEGTDHLDGLLTANQRWRHASDDGYDPWEHIETAPDGEAGRCVCFELGLDDDGEVHTKLLED